MEKITLHELGNKKGWKKAVVVFKSESYTKPYTEIERSYEINSDAKYFDGNMLGSSLFGNCLDGKDNGVRLDKYIHAVNGWDVEYCYIIK